MKEFLKNISIALLLAVGYTQLAGLASAQTTPSLMITWKANDYAPASFRGKILPVDGSQIDMALEIIDGGKIASLSGYDIQWLINDGELKHGFGLKNISFSAEGFKGDQVVDITIKGYKGQDLEKTITIPLASPEVVITGGPDLFEALPYFFNIQTLSQLRFIWSANGNQASGLVNDQTKISLDTSKISSGTDVSLKVEVGNSLKPLEIASQTITIKK